MAGTRTAEGVVGLVAARGVGVAGHQGERPRLGSGDVGEGGGDCLERRALAARGALGGRGEHHGASGAEVDVADAHGLCDRLGYDQQVLGRSVEASRGGATVLQADLRSGRGRELARLAALLHRGQA